MRCAGEYMRLMKAVAQEDGQSTFFQGQKASRGLAFARRKRWALDVFVRNAQLVEFPACLAKLELERVQLTLKAARGRRRGNGPVALSGKTSSPPPPPPRRPAERGKCRPPCTFQGPFRGKRENSPESAELPKTRGKYLPLRNTGPSNGGTVTSQTRENFPYYPTSWLPPPTAPGVS